MTKEEIKASISMQDVLKHNGITIKRSGFINCPFHIEKTDSMKIYQDSFHCFGCGESGDIFDMEMQLNGCDFRTAFELLGGSSKPSWRATVTANKIRREKQVANQRRLEEMEQVNQVRDYITTYRNLLSIEQPFSELWCYCRNKLLYQEYLLESMLELGK